MPRRKARRRSSRSRKSPALDLSENTVRHISGIVQIGFGVLVLLALREQAGPIGNSLNTFLTFFFGRWGMIFPLFLIGSGVLHWFAAENFFEAKRSVGLLLCFLAFLGVMHMRAPLEDLAPMRDELAGAIGFTVSLPFVLFTTRAVGYTVLSAVFLIGVFVAFEPDLGAIARGTVSLIKLPQRKKLRVKHRVRDEDAEEYEDENEEDQKYAESDDEDEEYEDEEEPELNIIRPAFAKKVAKEKAKKNIKEKMQDTLKMQDTRFEEWTFPSFDLLDSAHSELTVDDEELKKQARLIEEKLGEFEIEVTVRDARPGPTVTQFTLQPSEGIKLSRIANMKDDLALALEAPCLRIEAPIPGKALVGIEMPNKKRTLVHLREILESPEFVQSTSSLTLPLGRDVSGDAVVEDLAGMPHLLIAGATGSGKSICMNTFLVSLLYQNAPHELKFIMVDPKRVELVPFDGIPHLLTPVITESEKALQAFRWVVAEMGRRLHRFSELGVRNLEEYNEKQMEEENVLPRIVLVVDELADLMMRQYRRDTETMIVRIAQMARATGMHLIIATQRPSVDVVTGLIKANIPTRIAFRTVSSIDSRTIIDSMGAEDLLGKGDMLYMTALTPKPMRVQGIYISTKESERVINAVKIAGGGKITEQIGMVDDDEEDSFQADIPAASYQNIDLEADDNGGDDLFFDAVRVVQETGRASASLLQRQLKVGYARAARLLDIMEEKGLIGPADGAKARKVYMTSNS
ncbi:DNA translocase FtsK [Patescibacteria group bacterium]|nr:DNA translocase FtsK [Patescibacteria group bacterium]MBU2259784.1 DNA translocase FtsK [Patescibacteria group bacterium]